MTATYEGFTRKQKLFVVGSAIVAVFISLAFAAWIMGDAFRNMQFSQQDQEVVNRLLGDTTDPEHKSILRAHAIDTVANLKQLANRQSIIIVAFAGAFALSAVGIALFLLGADSAFQVQAGQGKGGLQLLLAGTAPGILCLLLAITLIGIAIAYRSSVNLASTPLTKPIAGASEKSAAPSPAMVDAAAKASAQKEKAAADQRNTEQEARNQAAEIVAAKLATEKAAASKLIADQLVAAKSAADQAAIARQAIEKSAAEKVAAEKLAAERAGADKLAADRASAATLARNRAAADQALVEKARADRAAANKLAVDRAVAEKSAVAKARADKAAASKIAADGAAAEKLAIDKARADRAAANKLAADRAAANKLAADKAAGDAALAKKAALDRVDVASLTAERIALAGAPSEIYKRAVALRNGGETSQAVALLKYASSSGHGPASRLLAAIYREGALDVRANFRQAERYQALADVQGDR